MKRSLKIRNTVKTFIKLLINWSVTAFTFSKNRVIIPILKSLMLRRGLSTFINFLGLYSSFCLLRWLFSENQIDINDNFIIIIAYVLSILLPIFVLGKTFGYYLFRIQYYNKDHYSKLKILLKYIFYYLIFISSINSFLNPITQLLNTYTNINILPNSLWRLEICLYILTFLSFIISLGKFTWIDYILNIQLCEKRFKRRSYAALLIFFSFLYVFLVWGAVKWKIEYNVIIEEQLELMQEQIIYDYYPNDMFLNYIESYSVFQVPERDIISKNELFSLIQNINFDMINSASVTINTNTFSSYEKRKNLCNLLLHFTELREYRMNIPTKQTKIEMKYIENGFFCKTQYNFTYYHDNYINNFEFYTIDKSYVANYREQYMNELEKYINTKYEFNMSLSDDKLNNIDSLCIYMNSFNISKSEIINFTSNYIMNNSPYGSCFRDFYTPFCEKSLFFDFGKYRYYLIYSNGLPKGSVIYLIYDLFIDKFNSLVKKSNFNFPLSRFDLNWYE